MTSVELAARLGLRTRDVNQAAKAGEIPSVRVGLEGLLFDFDVVCTVLQGRADATSNKEERHDS
ncbi:hypothetical protein OAF85_00755 [Planctomycetota bacterium]|nr:hypothetical protein [Planctomycetota bacterium]